MPTALDPLAFVSVNTSHHTPISSTGVAIGTMQKGVVYLLHVKKGLIFANLHGSWYEVSVCLCETHVVF